MPPRFLLDEHISPAVAELLKRAGIDAFAACGSPLEGMDDEPLFRWAVREGRIIVTYNIHDFADLFGVLLNEGLSIPGLVFVSRRTIPSSDFAGLSRSITKLAREIEQGVVDPGAAVFLTR